jgi:glyoxylase-like metal-dependent hydrolase (beta-lactamase superfamily II)
MIHEILAVGMLECNCSVLGDETTREAMVIDPGDEIDRIMAVVEGHGLTVKSIFITHAHIDHVMEVADIKRRTGAPVAMHPGEKELYDHLDTQASWLGVPPPERVEIDTWIKAGDRIRLGETEMEVLFTPGHSPASVSLWIASEKKAIVADTLFRRSIGRTDLPGGDHATLLRSIREKLFPLPKETVVVPGHGDLTTIGEEIKWNPFFS